MSDLKVLKVKVLKKGEEVTIITKESGNHDRSNVCEGKDVPHPDFLTAISALRPHLMVLNGWCKETEVKGHKDIVIFTATGYSIGGKDDSPSIVITGYRETPWGVVTANTPSMRLEQTETNAYLHLDDLLKVIEKIKGEALEYLNEGKMMPDNQGVFEFPEDKVTVAKIAPPATPEDHAAAFVKEQNEKIGKLKSVPRGKTDADPEAMQRVAEWDHTKDGAKKNKVAANKVTKPVKAGTGKKKVAQSADHPSGEVE